MPYIKQEDRTCFDGINTFVDVPDNAGELNYLLTVIWKAYFEFHGGRYQQMNDIIGALEGCKLEFYRRLITPYEDTKIKENGDVY